jgi:hypothetical protein
MIELNKELKILIDDLPLNKKKLLLHYLQYKIEEEIKSQTRVFTLSLYNKHNHHSIYNDYRNTF